MVNTLKVALIQAQLFWENPEDNRLHLKKMIYNVDADIFILPEMFTSGFTMSPGQVAETMNDKTVFWMQELAKTKQAAITGSLVIKENGTFYNRLLFVHPDGTIDYYNKRHTFTLAGENNIYTAGTERLIVDYKGWKICPLICYDLRFPIWSRNTVNFDMLLYVANWPKTRIKAWRSLLKARAIENMCYCIGVNRVGIDDNNHEYTGHSACYDVLGKNISNILPNKEQIDVITLNKTHIKTLREKLRFLDDRDSFILTK